MRGMAAGIVLLTVMALFPGLHAQAPSQTSTATPTPTAIAPGVSVERTIAAGERHEFTLDVLAQQVIKIAADPIGVDLRVALNADTPLPPGEADDQAKQYGRRNLLVWLAPASGSGTLRISVLATSTTSPDARYRMTATVYDPDARTAAAASALNDAIRLARQSTRASAEAAVPLFQQAITDWTAIGDREIAANARLRLGRLQHRELQRETDATATLAPALDIFESLGLPNDMAAVGEQLGAAQLMLGQQDKALATYQRTYTHAPDLHPLVRAIVEDDMARAWQDLGDLDRAAEFSERAAATFHDAHAGKDESVSLERLTLTYMKMQRFDDALQAITRAIDLGRQYGTPDDVAILTVTMGRLNMASGDEASAGDAFRHALDLFSPRAVAPSIATRIMLGRLYDREGEASRARTLLEETLAHMPEQMRDYRAAVASELGASLTMLGEPARALELQRQALEIVTASQSRSAELTVLRDLTTTYRALGDLDAASKTLDRADAIARTLPGQPYAAAVLRERARNARAARDLPLARQQLDAALALIESTRARVQSRALRASLGGQSAMYYADAIDIAMAMHAQAPGEGHDARAFELFERSRARSLTDLLAEARVDARGDLDPALLTERLDLQTQLGRKDTVLRDLPNTPRNKDRIDTLEGEITDLARRLDLLDSRIRAASPRYSALTRPATASLADTQGLLDEGTVLLAFDVAPTASWGWAITRSSMRSFPLPGADRIEPAARRVYADLIERHPRNLAAHAAALSDLVLGPIAGPLAGEWRDSRLAIIQTGPLEYVPFAALPLPAARASARRSPARAWVIDRHEVVQLPSASVLALLRSDVDAAAQRRAASPQSPDLAVLADPVYSAGDPRVHVSGPDSPPAAATRRAPAGLASGVEDDAMPAMFLRLYFSRKEAQAIARLAGGAPIIEALDFSASVATMKSPAVANARIVHIASHGILNSMKPELSGIALSLVDEQGRPTDGVLRLYDVFNLKLSADLVVLSGCQTGLGRQMTGEGLIGLTRGFMYAGAPRIIASLWEVDDVATAELMRHFYQALLTRKLTPALALATAQRRMRADPRWRSPFYWASFTLLGDWR